MCPLRIVIFSLESLPHFWLVRSAKKLPKMCQNELVLAGPIAVIEFFTFTLRNIIRQFLNGLLSLAVEWMRHCAIASQFTHNVTL